MSENSADSAVDDAEGGKRRARGGDMGGMTRRLRTLLCCLKREPSVEETVEYNPDECDYVVEKLVVRRVPLALFAIPADLANRRGRGATYNSSQSTSSSALGRNVNATRDTSARMDRTAANKALRFGDKLGRDSVSGSLNCRAKSSVWREAIPNRFNAVHLGMKESERSLKNSLNFSCSRQFAEDISEATSSTRTNVSSRTMSSVTVQDDIPTRDDSTHCGSSNPLFGFGSKRNNKLRAEKDEAARDVFSGKERDKFVPGRNRKYIVSPFRVRRGSFDLAKPKDVEGLRMDGKSLSYIEESLEDKSSEPMEDVKDRDLGSNAAVRWRITIRSQRANTTPEHAVSKCPSLEGKTHR